MLESAPLSPHFERLLRRLEGLESPLVQVWGWPGSGKSALLATFLATRGPAAAGVPLDSLGDGAALRTEVERAHAAGVRWLVAAGHPGDAALGAVARGLRPGQTLLFPGARRFRLPELPGAVLPPQELLLRGAEIASLALLLTGEHLPSAAAAALGAASDGWYRPLRLAFEATGGLGLDGADPEALLEIAPVRAFLRHEVLDTFTHEEREALLAAADERGAGGDEGWRLLAERGLWVEGEDGGERLPRLLAAWFERERRRRSPRAAPAAPPMSPAPRPDTAPAERPVFVLGLLGVPTARRRDAAGERDLDCRLRRSLQVLAYLASSPGLEAGRAELIEAVWPTEGERTIERNFHPTLSHLRRAFGGDRGDRKEDTSPLLFRSGVYRLNPEIGWEIDVLDFGALVKEGKALAARGERAAAAEARQRAWALYRGPFLQGHYEAWVTARRESYQRAYLEMLRELGDLYLHLGRPDEAMDAYRAVLIEDPLLERVHVTLMQIYAEQGRRDMVRRQYDRLSTLLHQELSVEPAAETTREYHRLMS